MPPLPNTQSYREWRDLLEKCAATSMSSKLIHSQKDFFKKMVVDAVLSLGGDMDEKMIGMKTVAGGALQVRLFCLGKGGWRAEGRETTAM